MARLRLDQALVQRNLIATRSRARDVIGRGLVSVNGKTITKAGALVSTDTHIELPADAGRYVSRGSLKLIAALDSFSFDVRDRICLDIGASTGGFTQVLLERGAAKVYAVDVGHGQLHKRLRNSCKVINLERTDARQLSRDLIAEPIDAIVADVSFISLTKLLGRSLALTADDAWLAALIKPQFEVGREGIGKGGIVRDPSLRIASVTKVRDWIELQPDWRVKAVRNSPIPGGTGTGIISSTAPDLQQPIAGEASSSSSSQGAIDKTHPNMTNLIATGNEEFLLGAYRRVVQHGHV